MMKNAILAAALAALCSSAFAKDYYVVVPVQGKAGGAHPAVEQINVALAAATLPAGQVGTGYSHDLKPYLTVTGDPKFSGADVTWSITAGSLPAGLVLDPSAGTLSGTPAAAGAANMTVAARYKSKSGSQTYSLQVVQASGTVAQYAGYRAWSDGQLASTCLGYLQPGDGHRYEGATGDGVYRIRLHDGSAVDTYCDMSSAGGGWTFVASLGLAAPVIGQTGAIALGGLTNPAPQPNVLSKLSDAAIERMPHSVKWVHIYAGTQAAKANYYPQSCALSFAGPVSSAGCATAFTDVALATPRATAGNDNSTAIGFLGLRLGTVTAYLASDRNPWPYLGAVQARAGIWVR